MKHRRKKLLLAVLMALTLLPFSVKAAADPIAPDAKNGALTVSVLCGGQWKQAGLVYCDEYIGHETVNLEGFVTPGQNATVRIVQLSGGASHLDAVFLGGAAPIAVTGGGETDGGKLSARDNDLIETSASGVVLTFSRSFTDTLLTVYARIESKNITKQPFIFPAVNLGRGIDESASFYAYVLDSNPGSLSIDGDIHETDGLRAFFSEYCITGTGHPPGYTYAWVQNDDNNLYVSMDFTPDNTMDGDKDYAKVYVNTARGLREFKVSVKEQAWGIPGFTYTSKVNYQHKVYEFAIPLSELGVSQGNESALQLAFAAYGTAAPVVYTATVTVNKDGSAWTADAPEIMIGYDYADALPNGSSFMNGTYNIYANGIDTGVDITVADAAATASLDYYTLALHAGTGITDVSGAGIYLSGDGADIDAVVAESYTWGSWSDGNTDKSRTVTVTDTLTLTASATPTPTPTPAPTAAPTHAPTRKPKPKPKPTPTPTPMASVTPILSSGTTASPDADNTAEPTDSSAHIAPPALSTDPAEAAPSAILPAGTNGNAAKGGAYGWLYWVAGGLFVTGAAAFTLLMLRKRRN